jgi:hypothetical protein
VFRCVDRIDLSFPEHRRQFLTGQVCKQHLNLAGFRSKWWATAKVWKVFGYRLKPHRQGTQVFYGKAADLQSQTVFNAEQVDGPDVERYLVGEAAASRPPAFDAAERVIAATGAAIRHVNGTQAVYYRLPKDIIIPLKAQFERGPTWPTSCGNWCCPSRSGAGR